MFLCLRETHTLSSERPRTFSVCVNKGRKQLTGVSGAKNKPAQHNWKQLSIRSNMPETNRQNVVDDDYSFLKELRTRAARYLCAGFAPWFPVRGTNMQGFRSLGHWKCRRSATSSVATADETDMGHASYPRCRCSSIIGKLKACMLSHTVTGRPDKFASVWIFPCDRRHSPLSFGIFCRHRWIFFVSQGTLNRSSWVMQMLTANFDSCATCCLFYIFSSCWSIYRGIHTGEEPVGHVRLTRL